MALSSLVPRRKRSTSLAEVENPFAWIRNEMNRLFDEFFESGPLARWGEDVELSRFAPRVNVTESDKEVKISAELPGMDEKDVEISLTPEALTIQGEKKVEHKGEEDGYQYLERSYGKFQRTIPLPAEIDPDKAEAVYDKGVLTVTLPKKQEAQSRGKRIEIKAK